MSPPRRRGGRLCAHLCRRGGISRRSLRRYQRRVNNAACRRLFLAVEHWWHLQRRIFSKRCGDFSRSLAKQRIADSERLLQSGEHLLKHGRLKHLVDLLTGPALQRVGANPRDYDIMRVKAAVLQKRLCLHAAARVCGSVVELLLAAQSHVVADHLLQADAHCALTALTLVGASMQQCGAPPPCAALSPRARR